MMFICYIRENGRSEKIAHSFFSIFWRVIIKSLYLCANKTICENEKKFYF